MWRFLGLIGLFFAIMGIATGIRFGDWTFAVGFTVVFVAVLLSIMFFTIRFVERASPDRVFRFLKVIAITGITLTCIAGIIGIVLRYKERQSNNVPEDIEITASNPRH